MPAVAVAEAIDGDTVIVACGKYKEAAAVHIKSSITIVADMRCKERPIVEAFTSSVLIFAAEYGIIRGLSFVQTGGLCGEGFPCSLTGKKLIDTIAPLHLLHMPLELQVRRILLWTSCRVC